MGEIGKTSALILTVIVAMSCLTVSIVKTANAQTITKPSVPEFVVQYVNHPYDLSPATTVDPYTGKTTVTSQGGHFDNFSIEVKIKNQAFVSTIDSSGNYTSLYYNLRFKGHYENETQWVYYPVQPDSHGGYLDAFKSDYSVFTLPKWKTSSIPQGGQIDVQVQALIGHDNKRDWGFKYMGAEWITFNFQGEYAEWSNTQTVTVDNNNALTYTASSNSPSPSVPELSWRVILPLLLAVFAVIAVVRYRKKP